MLIRSIKSGTRHRANVGDVTTLAASIKTLGLLQPVVVDGNNRLVAGARRLAAVRALGWRDVPVRVVKTLGDAAQALRAERDENTERQPFKPSELVSLARALEPLEREAAEQRERSGKGHDGSGGRGNKRKPGETVALGFGKSRDKVASAVGVSHLTLSRAKKVVEAAERNPKRFGRLVSEMDASGNVAAAYAQLQRLERTDAARRAGRLPSGKFRVILADCPWRYDHHDGAAHGNNGNAVSHYGTMTLPELCALPVKNHVERDAVLFMWVTSPLVVEALEVIGAWGFTYKSSFVWDKVGHMFGHYNSVRHEFLFVCTRGTCTPDRPTPMPDSVQSIPKSRVHSEKPEEFRRIIERLYPFGRRLELFGRRQVKGWTVWGDQVPGGEASRV